MAIRRGLHLSRSEKNLAGHAIQAHGARADRGFYRVCDHPLSALLACDGERALAGAGERLTRIEARGVNSAADGQRRFHRTILRAHDDELLRIAAADKQEMRRGINGHADGTASGSDRPAGDDLAGVQVNYGYQLLVHEIDVDFAG